MQDCAIHASLSCEEMLYLSVGYDWMLFGHHLANRLERKEEIFYFAFDFLRVCRQRIQFFLDCFSVAFGLDYVS